MQKLIAMKNKYGQTIWSMPDNHIAEAIIKHGVYDEHAIQYIEKILKAMPASPVVLDIGAHIGNHALVMTQHSKMVYCFEPMSENVTVLQRNQADNHIQNMQIFPFALSDKNENLTFYKDGSTFVSELQHEGSATETLTCKIGDEVLLENNINQIDFIKIDVEGFEAQALRGLSHSIQASQPVVMMEWNNDTTRELFVKYDLFNTVFKNYQVRAISHNHQKHYWGVKWYSQIARFVYRKFVTKRRLLTAFTPEGEYTNILLFPVDKSWVAAL